MKRFSSTSPSSELIGVAESVVLQIHTSVHTCIQNTSTRTLSREVSLRTSSHVRRMILIASDDKVDPVAGKAQQVILKQQKQCRHADMEIKRVCGFKHVRMHSTARRCRVQAILQRCKGGRGARILIATVPSFHAYSSKNSPLKSPNSEHDTEDAPMPCFLYNLSTASMAT